MEKKELNVNNSKKLFIGISILFCTVILIIGTSIAYFTQSDTKPIDEIVSEDQVSLQYNDTNNNYMLGNLIPINESDVEMAYNREGENKCKDDNGYNVCSIYRFTISNTSDVTQQLVINMKPILNSFYNLKYNIYEINNGVSTNIKKNQSLTYDDKTLINLFNNLTLNNRSSKTYEIAYYVLNNPNANQNLEDAGKKFGAQIIVNSVTTGKYVSKQIGESCYKVIEIGTENTDTTYYSETIDEKYQGSYILTEFYGIDETDPNNPKPVEGCGVTQDQNGFYSVTVPSKIGDKKISTLGNSLFLGADFSKGVFTEKSKIKFIEIEDGIEIIEDGNAEIGPMAFGYIGLYFKKGSTSAFGEGSGVYDFDFQIKLPNTLKHIGNGAFMVNNIKEITIPKSVETINDYAFGSDSGARLLSKVTFEGAEDNTSNLKTIGESAFRKCNLTYTDPLNPLIIPSSVTSIGRNAFHSYANGTDLNPQNHNLNYIKFNGTLTAGNIDWYKSVENGGTTTLVP